VLAIVLPQDKAACLFCASADTTKSGTTERKRKKRKKKKREKKNRVRGERKDVMFQTSYIPSYIPPPHHHTNHPLPPHFLSPLHGRTEF